MLRYVTHYWERKKTTCQASDSALIISLWMTYRDFFTGCYLSLTSCLVSLLPSWVWVCASVSPEMVGVIWCVIQISLSQVHTACQYRNRIYPQIHIIKCVDYLTDTDMFSCCLLLDFFLFHSLLCVLDDSEKNSKT